MLKRIVTSIGHNTDTSDAELRHTGRQLFGVHRFRGVFPRDQMPYLEVRGTSCVLNLDKYDEPGSHWIAVYCYGNAKLIVYDSYGRRIGVFPSHESFLNADLDAEQSEKERNCGQRCLAWLCVAYTDPQLALLI